MPKNCKAESTQDAQFDAKEMEPIGVNGSVHTARKQHQRKNVPLCVRVVRPVWIGHKHPSAHRLRTAVPLEALDSFIAHASLSRSLYPSFILRLRNQQHMRIYEEGTRNNFVLWRLSHRFAKIAEEQNCPTHESPCWWVRLPHTSPRGQP